MVTRKFLLGILAVGLFGASALLTSCVSSAVAQSPKLLAERTKGLVEGVKATEKSVYQVLAENLAGLKALRTKVRESKEPSQLLNEVLKELRRITKDFERMARREARIEEDILGKVRALHRLGDNAREEIERIRLKKADMERKLQTITDPDPTIAEMRRRAYSQTINYLRKQIEIWERFLQTHHQIEEEVKKIDKRVERFLTAIELSALVYREGFNTLQLQKDIQDAQALLREIPEIEQLTQEMVASWQTLDSLVEELLSFAP